MLYVQHMEKDEIQQIVRGRYYPHIDGLRAFAILSVLLYHAFPTFCSGGFIGVDVFFVISGYLITKGLLNDLQENKYSIGSFYVRRIRRIFPAYMSVILFSLILGCICYYGNDLLNLSKTALSSAAFCTNVYFYLRSGYFSPNAHENPLLNLWSLSVEEQYYIFFPLLLAALYKFFPKALKCTIWIFFIVSLILCGIITHQNAKLAFYWLPFRAWELLAGSLLAIHSKEHFLHIRFNITIIIALVCLFFLLASTIPFPGIVAVLPVLCAVLLLLSGDTGYAKNILEHPYTVYIGKISYSLYLYHWPLLVFSHYLLDDIWGNSNAAFSAVGLSLLISHFSWKYIEMPFRKTHWQQSSYFIFALLTLAFVISASVTSICLFQYETKYPRVRVESYWDGLAPNEKNYADPHWPSCENRTSNSLTVLGADSSPCYVLWGDSHAMATSPGWDDFSRRNNINGLYINRKHTLLFNTFSANYPRNDQWITSSLDWLAEHKELQTVVLINRWAVRAEGTTNENNAHIVYKRRDHKATKTEDIFRLGITELCQKLCDMGKNVIIISSIPEQGVDVSSRLNRLPLFSGYKNNMQSIPYPAYEERQRIVKNCFNMLEEQGLAHIIWVDKFFYPNGNPIELQQGGYSLYKDDDHLTPTGAKYLLRSLESELLPLLRQEQEPSS